MTEIEWRFSHRPPILLCETGDCNPASQATRHYSRGGSVSWAGLIDLAGHLLRRTLDLFCRQRRCGATGENDPSRTPTGHRSIEMGCIPDFAALRRGDNNREGNGYESQASLNI